MSQVRFYLKDLRTKSTTAIVVSFSYKGGRIRFSSGESIEPRYWNTRTQNPRETMDNQIWYITSERLDYIARTINMVYNQHKLYNTLPHATTLKSEFLQAIKHESVTQVSKSFWEHFEDFITYKKAQLTDSRDYNMSLRKHLTRAEENYGSTLTYDSFKDSQEGFIPILDHYLHFESKGADRSRGMSLNTIGKQHKNLKVFLNWSFDKGIIPRFSLKHIVTETEEIEAIYITEEELDLIEAYVPKNELEKIVRELFLIGCETGLRFSDFTRLTHENIANGQIRVRPKKTQGQINNKVVIPISDRVYRILAVNNGGFPQFGNRWLIDFNKTIRHIGKEVGINQIVHNQRMVNKSKVITKNYKHELISSHTCRRTFCTLKFFKEMPVQAIMKFSGHRTERSFMRYLKIDSEQAAIKYASYF